MERRANNYCEIGQLISRQASPVNPFLTKNGLESNQVNPYYYRTLQDLKLKWILYKQYHTLSDTQLDDIDAAFTQGLNNLISSLRRTAFDMTNFKHLRLRVLAISD